MKKSQLRKIIKESIKGLMNEHLSWRHPVTQPGSPMPHGNENWVHTTHSSTCAPGSRIYCVWHVCIPGDGAGSGWMGCIDGNTPQPGQKIYDIQGHPRYIVSCDPNNTTSPAGGNFGANHQSQTYACPNLDGSPIPPWPTPCDQTPASACATQWFGNTAGNFTAWMASKDCSNYQSVVNQLEPQAIALMAAAPNPQPGPYNDWNAIKNAANVSNLGQPQKGQFKRKMAKAKYAECQIQACNC